MYNDTFDKRKVGATRASVLQNGSRCSSASSLEASSWPVRLWYFFSTLTTLVYAIWPQCIVSSVSPAGVARGEGNERG